MIWQRPHLLDIESLTPDGIVTVLDTARAFKAVGERAIKSSGLARKNSDQSFYRALHADSHQF